jgi:uncharacterized protein with PIN domain
VRIRLYLDEDSGRASLARELRFRGADVVTAIEAGMAQKTDEEQLHWAAANSRVVYSFNRGDFYGLHTAWLKTGRSHSGIVLSRQGLSVGEQMRRLLRVVAERSPDEMRNHVEFLSAWG